MKRLVIRFEDGRVHSFDLVPGRELPDLRRHLGFFPERRVKAVEEQVYAPEHPRRFVYTPRPDLLQEVNRDEGEEGVVAGDSHSPPSSPEG